MQVGNISFNGVEAPVPQQPKETQQQTKISFKANPIDEEKSNATKYMIGATAIAGLVALGIAGYKGHLGEGIQKFLGGVDKATKNAAEKLGIEAKQYVKLKKEFDAITKQEGKFTTEQLTGKLRTLAEKNILNRTDDAYIIKAKYLEKEMIKELKVDKIPENSLVLFISENGLKNPKHCELILHDGLADDIAQKFGDKNICKLDIV